MANINTLIDLQNGVNFDPDYSPNINKISGIADIATASFQLSFKDAETASLVRTFENNAVERDDDVLPPEELNKMYPISNPFNAPMSKAKAERIYKEHKEREELQTIIQRGNGSLAQSIVSFGSSIAAQAVDPIGIGIGLVTGSLATKAIAKAATFSKTAEALTAAIKAGKNPLLRNIAEGVTGNVISEAAFVMPNSIQERRDIDSMNNIMNAIYGGAGFPIALKSIGLGFKHLSKVMDLTEMRMNAGKKAFGSAMEIEAASRYVSDELDKNIKAIESELPKIKDEELALKRSQELEGLKQHKKEIETELAKEVEIRQKANAPEQDLYYSKYAEEEVNKFDPNEEVDMKSVVDNEFEQTLLGIEDEGIKSEVMKEQSVHNERRAKISETIKAAAVCARDFLGGTVE